MRYHTNSHGEPAPCNAKPGECPLGGDHYDSPEEAVQAFEERNSESLFAPQAKLLTNNLDDAFAPREVDPVVVSSAGRTFPEDMALQEQKFIEDDIAQHKKAMSAGFGPNEIHNVSAPRGAIKRFGDPDELQRAWLLKDYDKVRELYARAHVRQFGKDPDFRMSVEDLVAQSRS